jgi:hypothetical protein
MGMNRIAASVFAFTTAVLAAVTLQAGAAVASPAGSEQPSSGSSSSAGNVSATAESTSTAATTATAATASVSSAGTSAPRPSVHAASAGTSFGTLLVADPPFAAAADAGSTYLVGQLVDGNHLKNDYGPDYGLTADLAIALAASGHQDAVLAKIVGYLEAHVADYADPAGTGQYPGPYSGAIGKLGVLAEITGQDPHSFGGFDLLTVLTGSVCPAADSAGACTAAGDFYQSYSTVSQSLAILALARGGVTPPAAAVARLEDLQCSDGGFSSPLITVGQTCASEVDTTSYAAQALSLVPAASAAAVKAHSYLLDAQQADGGFTGAAGENSNSTGLGAQALLALDGTATVPAGTTPQAVSAGSDPVAAARAFLLTLQSADGGFVVNSTTPGSDVRSTTQAVPALAGQTLVALSDPVTAVAPVATAVPSSSGASRPSTATPAAPSLGNSALAGSAAAAGTDALAATGAPTRQPLLLGLALILAGAVALGFTRRPLRQPARAGGRRH